MSVWLTIPSKRPPAERDSILKLWKDRSYKVALWLDGPPSCVNQLVIDHWDGSDAYPGYAVAVNSLVRYVLEQDPNCDWVVIGGDDVEPDLVHQADEIAWECTRHFQGTYGIMQPVGHSWGDRNGPYIKRVCGSAWIGREWCQRANRGVGPLYPEFQHMFVDECLQEVATIQGVLWQHEGLKQVHRHWGLPLPGERLAPRERMPAFLEKWNTPEHWRESKAILERLRADGWKECLPIGT